MERKFYFLLIACLAVASFATFAPEANAAKGYTWYGYLYSNRGSAVPSSRTVYENGWTLTRIGKNTYWSYSSRDDRYYKKSNPNIDYDGNWNGSFKGHFKNRLKW